MTNNYTFKKIILKIYKHNVENNIKYILYQHNVKKN